ncbi:hypothetical protein MBRA_06510 [Mycobacterium branderi]|uniref:Mycofactocin n=2 Tax=Mycobacterium branderi TaxID=43348 RepID=A0ABN6B0Q6_9MYCO|nr:hypothetical protein MBRA_06510 [Mycobacterium branderi]
MRRRRAAPAHPRLSQHDPPFHFGTRCHILTEIVEPLTMKGKFMEPNNQIDTDTELVTETLVEEVSIDGMCGVY